VRYWKRAIEITVELGVQVMNSEFNGRPEKQPESEAPFWRSLEELLPIFEREGIQLRLEPHPDDFIEDGRDPVDMVRGINSPNVTFLYCAPHTFHMGGDIAGIMEYAGDLVTHLHVADSLDHRASSGLRYIVNPPGSTARVHQHLDIGQGEVDWDVFFGTLERLEFDGIMTACVFAWEERARVVALHARGDGAPHARLEAAYESGGWSAATTGALLDALHLAQLVTALTLPALAERPWDRRPTVLASVSCTVIGAALLFVAPGATAWIATVGLGLGLGGGFTLGLLLMADLAGSPWPPTASPR
jgi:hypothetical protein